MDVNDSAQKPLITTLHEADKHKLAQLEPVLIAQHMIKS